jgi:large subunit ribosomal protein L10
MNRAQKEVFVEDIRARFEGSPLVILAEFSGSSVSETDQLRRACEPAGARFQVVKNTLCRRALEGTEKEALTDHFRGSVGVLFAGEDAIACAKVFKDQAKTNKNLQIKVGYFEGEVLDAAGVSAVAELPSREELLATVLATILEAPRRVMGVIKAPGRDLVYLLNNYATKLEGEA